MPVLTPPQQTVLTAAAAAGAVAGVAALAWSVVQLKRHHNDASESAGVEPESWTAAQVAAWLHANGVSKASSALCLRCKLTGAALLQVTERDLYRMGVPLRDARVVLAAVEDLKETPVLLARVSQPATSRQPSLASAASHPPAAPPAVTTASPSERFESAWRALMRTCVLQPDDASPSEQQQRAVVYTSALLECFQALSPREQATALALVAAAEDFAAPTPVSAARDGASPTPAAAVVEAAPTTDDAASAFRAVEDKLVPLHAMVDGFLEFLQSPELRAVPDEDFEELGARVAGQVKRVMRVCEQLPAEMGSPLLRKCEMVFALLSSRQSAPATAKAGEEESRKAVMQALYDVITSVKSPALGQLPPAQRVKALSGLATRAEAIQQLASGAVEGVAKDEQVLKIVQPVLQLIQEAARVSAAEAEAEEAAAAVAAEASAEADEEEKDRKEQQEAEEEEAVEKSMTSADVPVIVETIRKIQETLQSSEFQHAPAEVRAQLCAVLSQRITALEDRTGSLPAPTQSAVTELLRNTKSVLAAVGNAAAASARGVTAEGETVADEAEEGEEEEGEGEVAAQEDGEEEEAAEHEGLGIERYVEQLEKIFEFLTSEALEQAPAEDRAKMAAELMERVDRIRAEITGSAAEGPIVTELIEPLYDLLKNMATTGSPSQRFLEVTAPLREVQELLSSTAFQQAPHTEKMRIARGVVPQLQQLTSSFSALSASERAAAEELVRPISEELLSVVRERPAAQVSAQSVLDRLQAVMRTIQGAEFTTMTPAARGAWAANAVSELERLNDDCVALGPEGEALRPIVQRLETQLRGLFAMSEGTGKAPATAPATAPGAARAQEGARQGAGAPWADVRAMQAELAQAEAAGVFVEPARLQQMLSVLGTAAEAADMTEAQEDLLQEFGESLRRHVEGATEASPDDDAEEDGDDDDALDSLRVSLQTLLDVALEEDGGVSGAALSSIAAKTEELIAMADEAGVAWREDMPCARAVRSILEILQQAGASGEERPTPTTTTGAATEPSKVEEVLQSSLQALAQSPPASREDFAPFMRVLQLAQPAAEHMSNRELVLLKALQEAVIHAMRRLPNPAQTSEEDDNGNGSAVPEHEEDEEAEEGEGEEQEEADDVDAVLDALLDMSFKLRDGSYSAEQLDEFEVIQHDLEDLLTRAGVDSTEAMASVREQIRLQRHALRRAEEGEEEEEEGEEEREEDAAAGPLGGAGEQQQPAREGTNAFNEDDDDAASEGPVVVDAADPAQRDDGGKAPEEEAEE